MLDWMEPFLEHFKCQKKSGRLEWRTKQSSCRESTDGFHVCSDPRETPNKHQTNTKQTPNKHNTRVTRANKYIPTHDRSNLVFKLCIQQVTCTTSHGLAMIAVPSAPLRLPATKMKRRLPLTIISPQSSRDWNMICVCSLAILMAILHVNMSTQHARCIITENK